MLRSTKTKTTFLSIAAAALLLLATACGSSGDDTSAGDTAAPPTSTASGGGGGSDLCADTGSPEWEQVVAAAQDEGEVVLYHSKSDEWAKTLLDAFEAEYGISGTSFRSTSGPLIQRIEQELAAGQLNGDLVLSGDPVYAKETYGSAGKLLDPIGPAAEAYPAEDIDAGVVVMGNTPLGILYNTDAISTPPTDWDDVTADPELRVGLVDPAATSNWSAVYDLIEQHAPAGTLEEMAAQDSKIDQTSVTLVQSIVSGELDYTPFGFGYNLNQFPGQDVPVDIAYPESGTFVFTQVGWVHEDAAHPNAGLLLENFLMCPEGQAILNGNGEGISPIDGVEGAIEISDATQVYPIDLGQYSEDEIRAINEQWNTLFAG